MWDTIELFDALSMATVPRDQNMEAYVLAIVVAYLQPCEQLMVGETKMEVIFRPSI